MRYRRGQEAIAIILYLMFLTAGLCIVAVNRPLWYDEIFTLYLVKDSADLFVNLHNGVDLNPPMYYWLAAACYNWTGIEWTIRIPSITAVWIASLSIYAYVRRRHGIDAAWMAMPLLMLSPGIAFYFQEARPYALTIACTCLAFLAYSHASEAGPGRSKWHGLLGVALAFGMLSHYYFALVVGCFACGELVRIRQRRAIDWMMIVMLAMPVMALILMIPLWRDAANAYSQGFWSQSTLSWQSVHSAYGQLFDESAMTLFLLLVVTAILIRQFASTDNSLSVRIPPWESVLLGMLATLPIIGIFITAMTHSAFHHRYVMSVIVGVAIMLGMFLSSTVKTSQWGHRGIVILIVANALFGFWHSEYQKTRRTRIEMASLTDFLVTHTGRPTYDNLVILNSPIMFLQRSHYVWDHRHLSVTACNTDYAWKHHYHDTGDRGLLALNAMHPLPILDLSKVLQDLDHGMNLYLLIAPDGDSGWQMAELKERGYRFVYVAERWDAKLYRILPKDEQ